MRSIIQDKRGQMVLGEFSLFNIIIISLLATIFFGGLIYVSSLLNSSFTQIGVQNTPSNAGQPGTTSANYTLAAQETFGVMNSSIQNLRIVAFTLIISMLLASIALGYLGRKVSPIFFFIYILIVVLAVIFSAMISNAYVSIMGSGIYGGLLTSFTAVNWILENLPTVIAITGGLTAILMFINIIRPVDEGGLV